VCLSILRAAGTVKRRRRAGPSPAARLRSLWIVWLLLGLLLAVGAYQVMLWPGFHLQRLVVTGTSIVSPDEVAHRAAIDRTKNIWLQDMHTAAARVEAIPWVAQAHVHRMLPASVTIVVVERSAQGCVVAANGDRFTVDASARVLEAGCARIARPIFLVPQMPNLPVPGTFVHSAELAQLQNDASALERLQPATFVTLSLDTFGSLEAVMRSGIRVKFGGDDDLAMKARLLDSILASSSVRLPDLAGVDLRAPAAPVVDYR
jgi:cell division protein FtsQ